MRQEIVADFGAFVDDHVGMQHGVAAEADVLAHHGERPDGAVFADYRAGRHVGQRMNTRRRPRRLVKQRQGAREIQVGIVGNQAGDAGYRMRNQDGGGPGVLHLVRVFRIGQKGQIAGAGMFHARHPADFQIAIAFQPATQAGRDFRKLHRSFSVTSSAEAPAPGQTAHANTAKENATAHRRHFL